MSDYIGPKERAAIIRKFLRGIPELKKLGVTIGKGTGYAWIKIRGTGDWGEFTSEERAALELVGFTTYGSLSPEDSKHWVQWIQDGAKKVEHVPFVEAPAAAPVRCVGSEAARMVAKEQVEEVTEERFVHADFAILNKNNTIEEYQSEVGSGNYRAELCKITHTVNLTPEQWESFTHNFLYDMHWLTGKGGSDSTADLPEVNDFWDYTPEQQAEWQKHSYLLAVEVRCEGQGAIYVDPSGHSYARYVGLNGAPVAKEVDAAQELLPTQAEEVPASPQLGPDDYVAIPGTILTVLATEAATLVAQVCHGLRAGLPIPERVYYVQGLENVANAWLLARCDNGATVKETPIEGSQLSLYEPFWQPLETSEED